MRNARLDTTEMSVFHRMESLWPSKNPSKPKATVMRSAAFGMSAEFAGHLFPYSCATRLPTVAWDD
jgi:hypothetical protein